MVSVIATICESLSFVHASDFLPMLIYVTLLANPKNLHANVLYSIIPFNHIELTPLEYRYIQRFRAPSRFRGEPAYFLTNVASALVFLENLRPNQLSIDPILFAKYVKQYERAYSNLLSYRRLKENEQADLACKSAVPITPERSQSKELLMLFDNEDGKFVCLCL